MTALHLFSSHPDDQPLRMRDCYEEFLLPDLHQKAAGTRQIYQTTIKRWEQFTSNPPIHLVTDQTLRNFFQELKKGGSGNANINKYWRHLRVILRRVGPRGYGNPKGENIISRLPYFEPLPTPQRNRKRVATRKELSLIYEACKLADWPNSCKAPAPLVWRVAFVFLYNYGPRVGDLFSLSRSNVTFEPTCPDPLITIKNKYGWFEFVPEKTKRLKPDPLILPLNKTTRRHLEMLFEFGDEKKILPVTHAPRYWRLFRKEIQEFAGIQNPYTFQELRKTCNTAYDSDWPGVGSLVLGHAPRGVNETAYLNQVSKRLVKAVRNLRQPKAFKEAI